MGKVVNVVIGDKAYQMTRKMAKSIIDMAKQKYKNENVNAIVAVEKDNIISMQRDVHKEDTFVDAVANWSRGGYKVYYVKGEK